MLKSKANLFNYLNLKIKYSNLRNNKQKLNTNYNLSYKKFNKSQLIIFLNLIKLLLQLFNLQNLSLNLPPLLNKRKLNQLKNSQQQQNNNSKHNLFQKYQSLYNKKLTPNK